MEISWGIFLCIGRRRSRKRRYGKTFVGFEGGCFEGVLLGLWRGRRGGGDDGDGAGREEREDLVSHRVIIDLSYLVA